LQISAQAGKLAAPLGVRGLARGRRAVGEGITADTSYEIYFRKKGSDRWMMDSRYGTFSKQEALDDAKELERQPDVDAVRVVREIHDADTGSTRDTVIWTSSKLKKAGGGGDSGPRRPSDDDDDDDDGPAPPPRRPASVRVAPTAAAADDDDEDEEEEEAPKKSWFKRAAGAAAAVGAGKGKALAGPSGTRVYKVLVKLVMIVFVSFFIATMTTIFYEQFLA
jgi:murein DD-endopeptidase MepM/ murein hydrolase activator NlpD